MDKPVPGGFGSLDSLCCSVSAFTLKKNKTNKPVNPFVVFFSFFLPDIFVFGASVGGALFFVCSVMLAVATHLLLYFFQSELLPQHV